MSKFTRIIKWAKDKGYEIKDTYAYGDNKAVLIVVDEENSFKCETRDSTVYMSIRGQRGNAGGLYLTHKRKPKDGRFIRDYAFLQSSQKEMIMVMEGQIRKLSEKGNC